MFSIAQQYMSQLLVQKEFNRIQKEFGVVQKLSKSWDAEAVLVARGHCTINFHILGGANKTIQWELLELIGGSFQFAICNNIYHLQKPNSNFCCKHVYGSEKIIL